MTQLTDLIRSCDVKTGKGVISLRLSRESLDRYYPGMVRFTLRAVLEGQELRIFRTNSYEYAPTEPADAETVAILTADEWEHELSTSPEAFLSCAYRLPRHRFPPERMTDVVVVQGSPRTGGNCSILAGWAVDAARSAGKSVQVIFPDDMYIRPCIGCYQCYNTGTCIHDDDMTGIIHAIRYAPLLVICTPVYTNSVPGGLKLLIDRCQAYHAEMTLSPEKPLPKQGVLLSVSGRRGAGNFSGVKGVVEAFFGNLGIQPAGEALFDGMDMLRDVRTVPGAETRVRALVELSLAASGAGRRSSPPPNL
jgi:multimeric flavodoxin WrbA